MDLICALTTASSSEQEVNAAYAHVILSNLSKVLTKKAEVGHADIPKYLDRLVPRLYNLFIHAAIIGDQGDAATGVARHPRLIQVGAKVIQQVIQTVPIE